ncbi:hypothetical protein ACHAQJ_010343 [Trichoderma viride]
MTLLESPLRFVLCSLAKNLPNVASEIPEILCFQHQHSPLRLEPGNQPVTLHDINSHYPHLSAELSNIPETQLIFFWTSSAFFTLVPPKVPTIRHTNIADSHGNVVGSTGIMELEHASRKTDGRGNRHEFSVLGSRRNQFSEAMLLVLQIEWEGSIAYRVNCGEIKEEARQREAHMWKLIALR